MVLLPCRDTDTSPILRRSVRSDGKHILVSDGAVGRGGRRSRLGQLGRIPGEESPRAGRLRLVLVLAGGHQTLLVVADVHAVRDLVDGAVVAELAAEHTQAAVAVDDVGLDGARLDALVVAVRTAVRTYAGVAHLTERVDVGSATNRSQQC